MPDIGVPRLSDIAEQQAIELLSSGVAGFQYAASRRSVVEIITSNQWELAEKSIEMLDEVHEMLAPKAVHQKPSNLVGEHPDDFPAYRVVTQVAGSIALSSTADIEQKMELLEVWTRVASGGAYRTVPSQAAGWIDVQEQLIEQRNLAAILDDEETCVNTTEVLERIYDDGLRPGVVKHLVLGVTGVAGSVVRAVLFK